MYSMNARQCGLTLIEILITLGLLAILALVATPDFLKMTHDNASASVSNTLVGALNAAKSDAVKQAHDVSICPSAKEVQPSCSTSNDWSRQSLVFDNPAQTNAVSSTNLVQVIPSMVGPGSGPSIQTNLMTQRVTFGANGSVVTPTAMPSPGCVIFTVRAGNGTDASTDYVTLSASGLIQSSSNPHQC